LKYNWTVSGMAVVKETAPGKLLLKRAQNSGTLIVKLALSNGGTEISSAATIMVKEPANDAWVKRAPEKDEKPFYNQFYARDDNNQGTLYYNGTLDQAADTVFLKVYADDKLSRTESQKLASDKTYAFAVKLKPGLIKYKVEFGSATGESQTVLHTVTNLVCGDAYLIDGQSNALAVDWGPGEHTDTSEWIRSFGSNGGDVSKGWGNAVRRQGGEWEIGCWGMDLARRLVDSQKIPICIVNGAVGGTLIEKHQRNPANPTDPESIYGRLLNRVKKARLTHGIRGVFWHQGENDQDAQGATGRYGWETYEQYFVDMSAAWKQDFPNIQHYYVFQIWPDSCSMGHNGASDKLRDVQRRLPRLYSNMSIMSTVGIKPEGYCHFPPAGYAEMARLISQLVERDNYGRVFDKPITPPDLKRAYYTSDRKDEIALEFDQPMAWTDSLISQFYLDGEKAIIDGAVSGNVVKLKLAGTAATRTISYLVDKKWDAKNLLYGQNGIAALTFCEVPVLAAQRSP
ncbi:MAG: sialate O-acetylesterase, partial [Thermoguttaceae bacterium]